MSRKKRGWKGNSIPAAPTAAASEGSRTISMTGNQGLFFSSEGNNREFSSVLREVQEFISSSHADLIISGGDGEARAQIKRYAAKYIRDNRIAVTGMTEKQLVDAIYTEMAEFSFLTKYIHAGGVEEIDVNAWNDVEVQYSDGTTKKLEERFENPEHAVNVVRRMLHVSGMVLDNASPAVLGHLSKNIRIAVLKTPLVDEDVGVAASIRVVNPQSMQKGDFIRGGTATEPMLDFLSECLRYGVSMCVAGATSSGKTTLAGWLLTTIPDGKRIFTIENGSRELALVRYQDGRICNSVIHTLTRDSENERQRIDQTSLLDMSLRFNPDVLVVGEMRGAEANAAQEAARTGVAVLTTIHSNSCEATYRRMVPCGDQRGRPTQESVLFSPGDDRGTGDPRPYRTQRPLFHALRRVACLVRGRSQRRHTLEKCVFGAGACGRSHVPALLVRPADLDALPEERGRRAGNRAVHHYLGIPPKRGYPDGGGGKRPVPESARQKRVRRISGAGEAHRPRSGRGDPRHEAEDRQRSVPRVVRRHIRVPARPQPENHADPNCQ
jgi:pilus assembly protein CpaF